MNYEMIALDMDGTALNSQKQIDQTTSAAIHRALAAGKEVVFCSGRSYAEMEEFLPEFPDMHYLCGESGAYVYDLQKQEAIQISSFSRDTVERIAQIAARQDVMLQFFRDGQSYVNRAQLEQLGRYQMADYYDGFVRSAHAVEDVIAALAGGDGGAEKINLYHTSHEARVRTRKQMEAEQLPTTLAFFEKTSLECSPPGISKATGLEILCRVKQISLEQVIMVGDTENDREGLLAAGLAVAMGNASPQVKEICDVVVADLDHGGCQEAISRYLLGIWDPGIKRAVGLK